MRVIPWVLLGARPQVGTWHREARCRRSRDRPSVTGLHGTGLPQSHFYFFVHVFPCAARLLLLLLLLLHFRQASAVVNPYAARAAVANPYGAVAAKKPSGAMANPYGAAAVAGGGSSKAKASGKSPARVSEVVLCCVRRKGEGGGAGVSCHAWP